MHDEIKLEKRKTPPKIKATIVRKESSDKTDTTNGYDGLLTHYAVYSRVLKALADFT